MWVFIACMVKYRNLPFTIKPPSWPIRTLHFSLPSPPLSLSISLSFLPYLIGFSCPCKLQSLMHHCIQAQYAVVVALIFSGSLFFALFRGFFGGKLCGFDLLGFFELYPCQSSLVSLVSFQLFHVYVLSFKIVDLLYLGVCLKFVVSRLLTLNSCRSEMKFCDLTWSSLLISRVF